MKDVIGYALFGCLIATAFCAAQADVLVIIWQGLKTGLGAIISYPFRSPRPFDVSRARRESHDLGFPFPESDGTLSRQPELRVNPGLIFQGGVPRFVVDSLRSTRESPDPRWVRRAAAEGWTCAAHGPSCDLRTTFCSLAPTGWRLFLQRP